jgi:hypothetical protein
MLRRPGYLGRRRFHAVEVEVAERIAVPFEGEGSGVEELTWAQFAAWRSMQKFGETEWTGGTMPLDAGTSVQDIVKLLRFIVSRHQSLRTRLLPGHDGPPKQVLAESGEITLEVYENDGDPQRLAAAIRADYEAAPWDPYTDWPLRMAVVADGDQAVHFVALYCHMVIDGYGFDALRLDLNNLDPATGAHLAPVTGVQPLELARAQQKPSTLRQHNASMRYWEKHLRVIEPQRFAQRLTPQDPQWCEATFRTPATHLALAVLSERMDVHSGVVLLAAHAVMLGRLSGQPVGMFRIVVSNRFRPGFAESVSNLAQAGLAVIDTADCTFEDAIARAWKSELAAGMNAYYHPRDLWPLIDRVSAERGVALDTRCYFNDRRFSAAQTRAGSMPTPEQITAALPGSSLRWGPASDEPDATCFLNIDVAPEAIDLTWRVDTAYVSPAMLEKCLRGMESLVVTAALDQATAPLPLNR